MPEKTIPALPSSPGIDENSLYVVDSGTETFKVSGANLALWIRETVLPAGVTTPYAGTTAPSGWLLCDGTAVSRTTYSRLFAVIATTYGVGDGVDTFNLPDARGRVIAGKDNMGGSAAGRLTTAVAGVDGITLGAAGGTQAYTPAGVNGGSQSIAHTHNFAHTHVWGYLDSDELFTRTTSSTSTTSMSASDTEIAQTSTRSVTSGGTSFGAATVGYFPAVNLYTTGVVSAPVGSGSTAVTAAMSTNATVNGVNFSFTGTAAHRVQPTLVMNTLIKT